jgi:hypothetical protein
VLLSNYQKVFKVKKLIHYVLTYAIITSYSTISRAADADSDEFNQGKAGHSIIIRDEDPEPSSIEDSQEGERDGMLYIKQSRLLEIIFSPPGEHETKGFSDPFLNGFKCVKFKNEKGIEEIYLLYPPFDREYASRFPNNGELVSLRIAGYTPGIPAWGFSVELPSKKKSSKKKGSHRKHRSKRTKKVIS